MLHLLFLPVLPTCFLSVNGLCTAIGFAKGALKQPVTLATQSDDAEGNFDYRIVYVPRRKRDSSGDNLRPCYDDNFNYPRLVDRKRAPHYAVPKGAAESKPIGIIIL